MILTRKSEKLSREFKRLYKLSFTRDERLPNRFLSHLLKDNKAELVHYYDEGKFIGYTYSVSFGEFICLAFFATNPEFRNKGYGKKILEIYSKANENKIIFLNCEVPENKDEQNIKFRRLSFYKRNGLILVPVVMSYNGIDYVTLVNKELSEKKVNEFNKMLNSTGCACRIDKSILTL